MGRRDKSRQVLEFQADRIEAVLARYKVPARVVGGTVVPRWVQFRVAPAVGVRVNRITALGDEIAMALNCATVRIARKDGLIVVEVPRKNPDRVSLLSLQRRVPTIPFGTALMGLDGSGAPLLVRLPSPQVAHLLIAGTTGCGKSVLSRTLIVSLTMRHRVNELGFVLIDPKRRAFGPLAGLPHLLRPVLSEPDEITAAMRSLVQLMLDRDRAGRVPASADRPGDPRVVVVIDELADLVMMAGEACAKPLTRLVQRGREAGIHVVACTQKPAAAVVGSLARANFPVRLVGQVTSPEEAKVATGYGGTGAENLRGPGEFMAVTGGHVTRFQGAYVSPRELAEFVGRFGRRTQPSRALTLPEPEPSVSEQPVDKLAEYVERARETWKQVRDPKGGLQWGGKADLAESIFGDRSTAGHRNKWIERVVTRLEREKRNGKARLAFDVETGALSSRRVKLVPKNTRDVKRRKRKQTRVSEAVVVVVFPLDFVLFFVFMLLAVVCQVLLILFCL